MFCFSWSMMFVLFQSECDVLFQSEYDDNRTDPYHGEEDKQDEPENLDLPEDLDLDQDEDGEEEDNTGAVTFCIVLVVDSIMF